MVKWKNVLHAKYKLKNCALAAASAITVVHAKKKKQNVHAKKKKQKTRKKRKKNPAAAVKENSGF